MGRLTIRRSPLGACHFDEVIEKIIWLRKHYHFGPGQDRHVSGPLQRLTISTSGVWRILKRLGMNGLPASQPYQRRTLRWKRYEKQRPGHQRQFDVKFIEPSGTQAAGRSTTSSPRSNDCTRLRMLRTYLRCDQKLSPVVALHALLAVVLLAGPLLKRHPVQRAGDAALGSRIDSSPISLG